ncbi:hypothetical protein PQG02_04120 [Nostoc sp. UHCC 0926]|uniref:hypothetical protein n=1 Tax=unclassified Nostoc TaxID=2593658 RepID=UPI00235ED69A|nr:hypothetical protein [Nostoc sp. UHCC 0926]WDD33576.1 hypothetical protein PQG02_04120 [Nostoc sp. UHCC 0926]
MLGAALFFAGWIYRWSYFYFFQLEVNTLDLPAQSFLIVPLQIFLGDGWTICKSAIAFFVAAIAIQATLLAIQESDKGHIIIRSPEASKSSSP